MNTQSIPAIVMAGVCVYVGFYHLIIYIRRPQSRQNLTFALTCFSISFYDVFCIGLYNVSSSEIGVKWQRAQVIALAMASINFIWFVSDYTKQTSKKWVKVLSVCYAVAGLIILTDRGELTYSFQPAIKKISLLFGLEVTYFEMVPGPITDITSLLGILIFGYSLLASIRLYKSGEERKAIPLFAAIVVIFIGVFNDTAVASGFFQFVYLIEYAFFALVFVMAYSLSTEIVRSLEYREALQKSEERYRFITENVADVIYTTDLKFRFTYVSPSIYQQRGYTVDEAMGQSLKEKVLPGSLEIIKNRHSDKIRLIKAGDPEGWKPTIFETEQYCKDGTTIWTSNNSQILPGPDKQPISILGITRDITSRKKAEDELKKAHADLELRVVERTDELNQSIKTLKQTQQELIRSERLAALGNMVAGIAHEINTPLGISVTEASFLNDKTTEISESFQSETLTQSNFQKYLKAMSESSNSILKNLMRSAKLIKSFKQVAVDQTTTEQRAFSIKEYLNGVILSLRSELKRTKHNITVECPEDLSINSYPGAFAQISTNFIMNSLLHGFDGIEQGDIKFNLKSDKNYLVFHYSDNGIGMDEENIKQIFDPFFTTKRNQGGTGLGMHIVYNIVTQKLNGNISCNSSLGKGTEFIIEIPLELQE